MSAFHIFTASHKEKKNQKEKGGCDDEIPTRKPSQGDISNEL